MRRLPSVLTLVLVGASVLGPAGAAVAHPAESAPVAVEEFTLDVVDGPADEFDVTIDATRYLPAEASPSDPAPVVLLAHGFGGDKTGYDALARTLAHHGYVTVTYSARGFGASTHEIGLDSVDYDVKDVAQLIDHIATWPEVQLDGPGDPRIGMHGDSYGGGITLQVAAEDDRLDAIAPRITWSSLIYSLTPNNLGETIDSPYEQPFGIFKQQWTTLFFSLGSAQPIASPDGFNPIPPTSECPGFVSGLCQTYLRISAQGRADQAAVDLLQDSSPDVRATGIDIPTFLIQGENDTLFNLREAVRNYEAVAANGAPVKMLWFNGGHSGPYAEGERVDEPHPGDVINERLIAWWDRYLGDDATVDTGPGLEFYEPWVDHDATTVATAYGSAPSYPAVADTTWFLSGDGSIVTDATAVTEGSASFVNPPGGQPAAFSEDALRSSGQEPREQPGQHVVFETAPLGTAHDLIGIPELTLPLSSATGTAWFHARIYDVAPDGSVTLPRRMTTPVLAEDLSEPLTFAMTGYVHRFEAGHRVRLVLASTDLSYSNRQVPDQYTVTISGDLPAELRLPLRVADAPEPDLVVDPADPVTEDAGLPTLPATGGGALLAIPGLLTLAAAMRLRRS